MPPELAEEPVLFAEVAPPAAEPFEADPFDVDPLEVESFEVESLDEPESLLAAAGLLPVPPEPESERESVR